MILSGILPVESYFRARVIPCRNDAQRLRDNIAYAILSVHVSTREADLLLSAWRAACRPALESEIVEAWTEIQVQFKNEKSIWIADLMRRSDAWIIENARNREALDEIKGLGKIKASFAAALNGARVACLDRHMLRDLRAGLDSALDRAGIKRPNRDARLQPKTWKAYRALERILVARHGGGIADAFTVQWRRWNQIRQTRETHEILWNRFETEVPF